MMTSALASVAAIAELNRRLESSALALASPKHRIPCPLSNVSLFKLFQRPIGSEIRAIAEVPRLPISKVRSGFEDTALVRLGVDLRASAHVRTSSTLLGSSLLGMT